MIGTNGYFPEQQDYAAFDEGDDFYTNGDEDSPIGQDLQGQANQAGATSRSTPSIQHGIKHNTTTISGAATPSSRLSEQQQAKGHIITAEDPAVKLATLRAKLMVKKDGQGKTPTPEPRVSKPNGHSETGESNNEFPKESKASGEYAGLGGVKKPSPGVAKATSFDTQSDVNSMVKSQGLLFQQQASGTDIEALFDEARAVEAAKKSKLAAEKEPEGITGHSNSNVNVSHAESNIAPSANRPQGTSSTSRRPSADSGRASSSTSEQGEIREEPNKLDRKLENRPPEPKLSIEHNGPKEKLKLSAEESNNNSQTKATLIKQQPQKIDTSVSHTRIGGTGLNSAKPRSPESAKSPVALKKKGIRDLPASTDSKDEFERYKEPLEYAYERPRDRRPQRDYDRDRPRETYSPHNVFRPQQKYRADEAEQAAAEYKKNLQKVRAEPRDATVAPQVAEETSTTQKPQVFENYEDVNTWLEMTGYFDEVYRTKALARHRKLVELDKQRAELEREDQIEREERLHIARAQSVRPRESIEVPSLRSHVTPQEFPSFSMPPPPLPTKETQEDVGMQIKDLAIRDAASAARRSEDDLRAPRQLLNSPIVLTPAVKRQYSEEDSGSPTARRTGKIARTDSRDYSFDKRRQPSPKPVKASPPSLESRISVDNGSYRQYQTRSKSPDSRRRSLSPYREASGSEMQLARQHSGSSRNVYSPPRRPGMSRDASPRRRDNGISYDDGYDSGTRGRYNAYRFDPDNRSNSGYDSYTANNQRGHYHNQQYQSTGYRARGARGRGRGYYNHNSRGGGYKPYDRGGSE